MKKLLIIKIGGGSIDDFHEFESVLSRFSSITDLKILVHGGGKIASQLAKQLNIPQTIIDGRRVTEVQTLDVAVMVYAGLINKKIVAQLQSKGCNAMGLSGADGNLIQSTKRQSNPVDYGFVGDILEDGININLMESLLQNGIVPVISPITHDGNGQLLNTNADTIASQIAIALSAKYETLLTYCFEKSGVLYDIEKDDSLIPILNRKEFEKLKNSGIISEGMLPKLENAFTALDKGVAKVTICKASNFDTDGVTQHLGTQLIKE